MGEVARSLQERAFETVPAPIAVLDTEGTLCIRNNNWDTLAETTQSPAFPTETNVDYLEACHKNTQVSSEFEEAVNTHLTDPPHSPTTLLEPFNGTVPGHRFLVAITGFEHGPDHYESLVFVDLTDIEDDRLTLREQLTNLQTALRTISHDLKTPLNIAGGYAELLAAETENDIEEIGKIQTAIARAVRITDDAMALAQEPGTLEREQVDIETVARSVWDDIERVRESATLTIDETASIEAHPGILARVFENLFTNAIQHGNRDVTIRIGVIDDSSAATIGLFVEDDGPGLPASSQGHLFEPGYKSETSEGYGIGLTIVQAGVRAHGWSITATNGKNGGARFEITGIQPADTF